MSAESVENTVATPGPQVDDEKHISHEVSVEANDVFEDDNRWYTKKIIFGKLAYNDALFQIIFMSFVFFLCPGMFNALGGIGGGGFSDNIVASNVNVALNSSFAVFGFFGGTINNYLGSKWTIVFGATGYCIYSGALLSFKENANQGFAIFAGVYLGICAGCLWDAQGAMMLAYPTEKAKGRYISIFWAIFNVGGVIGSIVPLAQTAGNKDAKAVSAGTYAAFIILMFLGICVGACLLDSKKVRKSDGTKVILKKDPTVWSEVKALFHLLRIEPWIFLLFPMFFASNWFYTYQQGSFNLYNFNVRTRSLNGLLYWFMQIVGALTWGLCLDIPFGTRKTKALVFHGVVFVLTMAIWGGGYKFQVEYLSVSRAEAAARTPEQLLDWSDKKFIGPMFLYMFYGFYDSVWQTYCYWLMGSLSNSSRKLALYVGFYKGIQNVGGAIVWRMDANNTGFIKMFASTWGVLAGSLLIALPIVMYKVKEHSDLEADAQFTDNLHAEELAREIGMSDKALQEFEEDK